jgi:peptidoglycan/LPS O-acetylase OafA/YrhL
MLTDANAGGALLGRSPQVESARPRLQRIKGLDGIRAFAVLGVIAFHTGLASVPGGFYGVDAFFVLSGFLITSLLVKEWSASGTIRLSRFWANRARRLLPALFLLVAALGIVMAGYPKLLATPHIIGDAVSTIFYVSNWYSIHGGQSYFAATAQPSPLLHTWSLAIEEQFYLLWPLIVLAVLKLGSSPKQQERRAQRRKNKASERVWTVRVLGGEHLMMFADDTGPTNAFSRIRRLHVLFALAALGALGSSLLMAHLAPNGYTTRAYFGTDTRAQALLVGASIALGLQVWHDATTKRNIARFGAVLSIAGVLGAAYLWTHVNETTTFAFSGGFLLASLAAGAVLLGAVLAPWGPVVRALEVWPLAALGRISYGVYLWYWPVLLVMSGQRIHWSVYPLFVARVVVTVTIAAISANAIEIPIRRGALPNWRALIAAPVGAGAAIGAVFISTLVPVGALQAPPGAITQLTTPTTTIQGAPVNGISGVLSPALPNGTAPIASSATSPQPIKVLLVGDSMAGTLGVGLSSYESDVNVQIVNEGLPGCSLAMAQQIKVLFYTIAPNKPCGPGDPGPLLGQWKKWVDAYNPDVVIYLARGETFNQEVNGSYENLGDGTFDGYVQNRFKEAISVLGSRGASVILMTSPYYNSGTSPSGSIWPEDAHNRVDLDNQIIQRVADSEVSHNVYVFDLGAMLDPGSEYTPVIDNVPIRCNDGVHMTPSGGVFVGLQLLPDLAVLGEAHRTDSPGGAWPGTLPPSTPKWYAPLPC